MNFTNLLNACFLGVIQGVTEFLPISSDGHLVIAQGYLPGLDQEAMTFDLMLHTKGRLQNFGYHCLIFGGVVLFLRWLGI